MLNMLNTKDRTTSQGGGRRRRTAAAAAALLMGSTVAVASGAPAQAADQYTACPNSLGHQFCLFKNKNFESLRYLSNVDRNSMSGTNIGNDAVSSAWNRETHITVLWVNTDCQGDSEWFSAGQAVANLHEAAYNFGDRTSSLDHQGQSACGTP